MPPESSSLRLAVLIDAENVPAKIADGLFEEIAKIGEASVRRIYGDFFNGRLKNTPSFPNNNFLTPPARMLPTSRW